MKRGMIRPDSTYLYCICPCGKGSIEREQESRVLDGLNYIIPANTVAYRIKCEECKGKLTFEQLSNFKYDLDKDPFEEEVVTEVKSEYYDVDLVGKHHHTLYIDRQLDDIVVDNVRHKMYHCKCANCSREYELMDTEFMIKSRMGKIGVNHSSKAYCKCWERDSKSKYNFAVSSFEWTAMKVFRDFDIDYYAEYELDIHGRGNKPLRADFLIIKGNYIYMVECNGEQHYEENYLSGGHDGFKRQQKYDGMKRGYCLEHGITYVEIDWEHHEYDQIVEILKQYGIIEVISYEYRPFTNEV